MVPSIAVMDPELTYSMPKNITAYTGMDALTHAIESYFSSNKNVITEVLSFKAITLILGSIAAAYKKSSEKPARYNMMLGSFTAGLAFANAGLGAVHGIGHPAGAVLKLPHGLVNAVLLPYVLEFNSSVIGPQLMQFKKATGIDMIKKIKSLNKSMGIPGKLSGAYKGAGKKAEEIIERVEYSASMSYNPVIMDRAKVRQILKEVL